MESLWLQICDIQGRLFKLAWKAGYDSEDFMKQFMRSRVARDLDSEYNRMQWAGEEYLLEEFADECPQTIKGNAQYDKEYNGPQEIDHLFPMNREHGKINQRKREESILCHEGNTHRNLRQKSFWRYSRESGSWEPLLRRTT